MTSPSRDALDRLFSEPLPQPDRRSCGAASLVVARMVVDPAYAELVLSGSRLERYRHEVLSMHRRVTGLVDLAGRLQVPWSRVIGTPPWAVARQMSATGGPGLARTSYVWRTAWPHPAGVFDAAAAGVGRGRPVPIFVGDRWLPRHVVLALAVVDGRLRCFEPGQGRLVDVERADVERASLRLGGWNKPWFVVRPVS